VWVRLAWWMELGLQLQASLRQAFPLAQPHLSVQTHLHGWGCQRRHGGCKAQDVSLQGLWFALKNVVFTRYVSTK
jgi:hypothetical protein